MVRLEVSGGRPRDKQRVRRVFELSGQDQRWLVERLRTGLPDLARRLSIGKPDDLLVLGRRDELPALRRLLDEQAAALPRELASVREAVIAAAEAERAAGVTVLNRRDGRGR